MVVTPECRLFEVPALQDVSGVFIGGEHAAFALTGQGGSGRVAPSTAHGWSSFFMKLAFSRVLVRSGQAEDHCANHRWPPLLGGKANSASGAVSTGSLSIDRVGKVDVATSRDIEGVRRVNHLHGSRTLFASVMAFDFDRRRVQEIFFDLAPEARRIFFPCSITRA
jgi:hypothetical protein